MAERTVVAQFFGEIRKRTKLNLQYAVGSMAARAKGRCEDLISARDHTLADLARMGHPYGIGPRVIIKKRSFGNVIEGVPRPPNPHDPPEVVHVQDGNLIAGLQATNPKGNSEGVSASVINTCKEDIWIQEGTPHMVARPYMDRVAEKYGDDILSVGRSEFERRGGFAEERSA